MHSVSFERDLKKLTASLTCDACGLSASELGISKFKKCQQCRIARYCGEACYHAAWDEHQPLCLEAKAEQDALKAKERAEAKAERKAAKAKEREAGDGDAGGGDKGGASQRADGAGPSGL